MCVEILINIKTTGDNLDERVFIVAQMNRLLIGR